MTKQNKTTTKTTKIAQYVKAMAKKGYHRCVVCVSGNGMYKNIAAHNKKQHGGRAPRISATA